MRAEQAHISELTGQLERDKRMRSKIEEDLNYREQEMKEKSNFLDLLRETEQRIQSEEREKYDAFRSQLMNEMNDVEVRRKTEYETRMRDLIAEREREFQKSNELYRE